MKLEIVFKDGRKETFDSVVSFNVTEERTASEVAQPPTEGKLFEVNLEKIYVNCFENPMSDQKQEWTRQIILEALDEAETNIEKYAAPFYTLIPEKNYNAAKTVAELMEYANNLGGQMADWVDQALEWAQRISNGESWEAVCNNADTANWYRMIVWKNGYARIVGGSCRCSNDDPASYVNDLDFGSVNRSINTVPLVRLYKK